MNVGYARVSTSSQILRIKLINSRVQAVKRSSQKKDQERMKRIVNSLRS